MDQHHHMGNGHKWTDPLEDFTKLHDYYGEEVKQLRADWLRRRQEEEAQLEEDLIDLSEH